MIESIHSTARLQSQGRMHGSAKRVRRVASSKSVLGFWDRMFFRRAPMILGWALLGLAAPPVQSAVWGPLDGWRDPHSEIDADREITFHEFYPALDPAWTPNSSNWIRLDRSSRIGIGYGATLNRVDGFGLLLSQELRSRGLGPAIRVYEGYGFTSEEWSGAIEVAVRPGLRNLELGARWADETIAWPLPRQAISSEENFAAAFFAREDFSDYLRRRGQAAFLRYSKQDVASLGLTYLAESHDSRRRRVAEFGIFGGRERFDENPSVDEGDWNAIQLRGYWTGGKDRSIWGPDLRRALLVDVIWSGGDLGGERWFTRVWAEHRGWIQISPAQSLGYRIQGGGTPQGVVASDQSLLPVQWQFQAGGVGSLRGHRFQEFRGDRLILGTLEYGLDVDANARPVLFLDGGMAWNESDNRAGGIAGSGPLALDGGIGVLFGCDGLRVDVARDLRARRAPARVSLRLERSF